MSAFYNEHDKYAAQWLRNLIDAGHIAPGIVDERSIVDLDPDELRGFTQCHFFAGIGVWSHALRLAGWPDDRPVWTGSCPCQPFSAAGKRGGHQDERHLWPAWQRLIRERKPAVVYGEQVASTDGLAWLDVVLSDLEDDHYAVAAADLPAAGVGAPHIRQRLYFVAHADGWNASAEGLQRRGEHRLQPACGGVGSLADDNGAGRGQQRIAQLLDSERAAQRDDAHGRGADDAWSACDWLPCSDGKARPVEPGTFPLAHGATARVGRLRAYGNAIIPQVAEAFIRASRYAASLDGASEPMREQRAG